MAVALETYTFLTLQNELKREFGDPGGADATQLRKDKINHAINVLWMRRPFHPWAVHPTSFNVAAKITRADEATITQDTATLNWTTSIDVDVSRWAVRIGVSGSESLEEYIIILPDNSTAGTSATLQANYTGPTISTTATTATFYQAYIDLPADWGRAHRLRISSNIRSWLIYEDPWTFELRRLRNLQATGPTTVYYYTIMMDPVKSSGVLGNRKYMSIWPRIDSLSRVEGVYIREPMHLVDDTDVLPFPHALRLMVFYWAAYELGLQMGLYDKAVAYQQVAERMIVDASRMEDFAEDDDTEMRGVYQDPLGGPTIPDTINS